MKKLGLALGSGGARGVAHIGLLQALLDNGIKPQCISGCSMGSVVGSCYAVGMSPKQMMDEVMALKMMDLMDPGINALYKGTLFKSKKLAATLGRYLGHINFDALSIPFSCIAADIITGDKIVYDKGEVLPAVQASSSIPLVFSPIQDNGRLICDGGIVCRVPVEEVRALGADVVLAMDVLAPLSRDVKIDNMLKYLLRVIDVYDNANTEKYKKEHPADLYIWPDLGNISMYKIDRPNFEICYRKGYECAMNAMPKIKKMIED